MNEISSYQQKVEFLYLVLFSLLIILALIFFRTWVLSIFIGSILGLLNFRLQIRGLKKFSNKNTPGSLMFYFYLRISLIASVLFISFLKSPTINPLIVFIVFIIMNLSPAIISVFLKQH